MRLISFFTLIWLHMTENIVGLHVFHKATDLWFTTRSREIGSRLNLSTTLCIIMSYITNLWLMSICHNLFLDFTLRTCARRFYFHSFFMNPILCQHSGYYLLITIFVLWPFCSSITLSVVAHHNEEILRIFHTHFYLNQQYYFFVKLILFKFYLFIRSYIIRFFECKTLLW